MNILLTFSSPRAWSVTVWSGGRGGVLIFLHVYCRICSWFRQFTNWHLLFQPAFSPADMLVLNWVLMLYLTRSVSDTSSWCELVLHQFIVKENGNNWLAEDAAQNPVSTLKSCVTTLIHNLNSSWHFKFPSTQSLFAPNATITWCYGIQIYTSYSQVFLKGQCHNNNLWGAEVANELTVVRHTFIAAQ